MSTYLNSASVSTPGLRGSNRPLGRRSAVALATGNDVAGPAQSMWSAACYIHPAAMISLHEQWRSYVFRLTASLAAAAGLDPCAAAAPASSVAAPPTCYPPAGPASATTGSGIRGGFVLAELAKPGLRRNSAASAGKGVKRLRAVLDEALSACAPLLQNAQPPPSLSEGARPLVGRAEVEAYSVRGISAATVGRLLTPSLLQAVEWHFSLARGG